MLKLFKNVLTLPRYTVKPTTPQDKEAISFLLKKTLQQLVNWVRSDAVPEIGKPNANTPFPTLMLFLHSFIDLLACTPRLTVDYRCKDKQHSHGYRHGALFD